MAINEMEKLMRELTKALENASSAEERDEILANAHQLFNTREYQEPMTEKTAKTADDFLDLADQAGSRQEYVRYVKKALMLDPSNIEARRREIPLENEHPYERMKALAKAVEDGKAYLAKKGLMDDDCIGKFWGIFETRPFIRMCDDYVNTLIECGMLRKAAEQAEEMIRLSENDNIGVRFTLMHLYAMLEEEEKAEALCNHYEKDFSSQMRFPLAVLYFKVQKEEEAARTLKKLAEHNKDMKKFLRYFKMDRLDEISGTQYAYGYQPFSIEELTTMVAEQEWFYDSLTVDAFIRWADKQFVKKK